ncbi:hypothetical protein [Paenibacillus crassostreae]|uniref:Uncharacterized protein n=1 Tax=Paenibacillus crassostreae TaxID=1763538 RepID=A0A167GSB0_9BACL|nr:hypothetical protein [Paenibacillus crassostreae]AOZ92046.1 hypothetical protein LPB68_07305 [Paenibacillus crassostreae]OAB77855.1 hypothetical protein PNBC_00385 [Paenibacillus crassostreae]
MDKQVKRYYQLKKKQKEIEQELGDLRNELINYCSEQGLTELEIGSYQVKIIMQERKEYDDSKLYAALPDPSVWKMISKADPAKITSLLKLNVITEETVKEALSLKKISVLQVNKS